MILRTFVGCAAVLFGTVCMGAVRYVPENVKVELSLKVPGNDAVDYKLYPDKLENSYFDKNCIPSACFGLHYLYTPDLFRLINCGLSPLKLRQLLNQVLLYLACR